MYVDKGDTLSVKFKFYFILQKKFPSNKNVQYLRGWLKESQQETSVGEDGTARFTAASDDGQLFTGTTLLIHSGTTLFIHRGTTLFIHRGTTKQQEQQYNIKQILSWKKLQMGWDPRAL